MTSSEPTWLAEAPAVGTEVGGVVGLVGVVVPLVPLVVALLAAATAAEARARKMVEAFILMVEVRVVEKSVFAVVRVQRLCYVQASE